MKKHTIADKFVLNLINNKIITEKDFVKQESGAVFLKDEGKKRFFQKWQEKKNETVVHPYLGEKIKWGLAPYAQALILSRVIRKELDEYPPFFWR